MTKIATYLGPVPQTEGQAELYRLSEEITFAGSETTSHVVVSAMEVPFLGEETGIFPSDEEGEILDDFALAGSFQGGLDIEKALTSAGYTVEGRN